MKNLPRFLFGCSVFAFAPIAANAAGTYYTGNYQSPQQQRYNTTAYSSPRVGYNTNGYNNYNNANSSVRYNAVGNWGGAQQQPQTSRAQRTTQNQTKSQSSGQKKGNGFYLDAGLSKEYAQWQFEMKESNSILHYDNLDWYVFDITGGYDFDLGNATLRVDAGFKYGIQGSESKMVDDDITNGGFLLTTWVDTQNKFIGDQIGHALSVGTSKDGSMMGFNVGVGLTDFFSIGNVRFTPSVGYRYLKYKLETKSNYGLSVDTAKCVQVPGSDEVQCNPAIVLHYPDGTEAILWDVDVGADGFWNVSGIDGIDPGQTYYYEQPGTSHSYEVDWAGPYLALDMDYVINQNNAVNGRVELGLPAYNAEGDQPYRFDWAHPKSVEDKGGMGDAFHIGLGANWTTAITDAVSLSIGLTYDYYTVSGADAKTYLNGNYYTELYQSRVDAWGSNPEDILGDNGDTIAKNIKNLESECPGWVCSSGGEIDSFYKSMGIRVGVNALF
ncbi:MAG: hypothetical protein ACI4NZ_03900 [Candidatus Enterousia sp.]